jgi:hypothetical protein
MWGKKKHSIPSRKHNKFNISIFTHISYLLLSWAGPLGRRGGKGLERRRMRTESGFVKGAGNLQEKCRKMRAKKCTFLASFCSPFFP